MDKLMADKKVKARLVVRGFKEKVKVQLDSPTGIKDTLHMLLTVAATKGWRIKSGDIKAPIFRASSLTRCTWSRDESNTSGGVIITPYGVFAMTT